jgi:hypothetical protein
MSIMKFIDNWDTVKKYMKSHGFSTNAELFNLYQHNKTTSKEYSYYFNIYKLIKGCPLKYHSNNLK